MAVAESQPVVERPNPTAVLFRKNWPEWACLTAYATLVAFMIPFHEPWADEAQAWMMARSLSLWQMLHIYLHYEGHPCLWYLLLWGLVHLRVSYAGMHWVCGLIAVCGTAVLLFQSPFPRWLKLSAPFSFFLLYQYSIVGRSYVLVPFLLFGIAVRWNRNPVVLAILLGLLANVAPHAFFISAGFALVYTIERAKLPEERDTGYGQNAYRCAAGVLFGLYAIAVMTAFPARDVYVAAYTVPGREPENPLFRMILSLVIPLWYLPHLYCLPTSAGGWTLVLAGMRSRGAIRFLIPIATLVGFCSAVTASLWHWGLALPTMLTSLWITWPAQRTGLSSAEKSMRWAIGVAIAIQVGWATRAYSYDFRHDTSPDVRTADFLKPYVAAGDLIAVTYVRDTGTEAFHSVGIAPYFTSKLYVNQPLPFWWWSREDTTEKDFLSSLAQHPKLIVVEDFGLESDGLAHEMSAPKIKLIESRGYHLVRAFFARQYMMGTYQLGLCHLVFIADSAPESRGRLDSRPPFRL